MIEKLSGWLLASISSPYDLLGGINNGVQPTHSKNLFVTPFLKIG